MGLKYPRRRQIQVLQSPAATKVPRPPLLEKTSCLLQGCQTPHPIPPPPCGVGPMVVSFTCRPRPCGFVVVVGSAPLS